MNVPRVFLSVIAGCSAALIAYAAAFVRGDLGGVMTYLHARAALRHLREGGAGPAAIQAAREHLQAVGTQVADPALAARLIPVALLVAVVVGALVWRLFDRQSSRPALSAQERMVERFARRNGGRFTLGDLSERSPLTGEQARTVTARMADLGRLTRDGETYRLS
ncbi:hypothetical protein E7T09_00695 [Deinococcus sp. KSM4-11]|uniref:hypothetical protein n=1 Tax=Deinococcus sp. KSM4-11 TaxID=2568654 RepID=UPI0010A5480C|nr:hypothetical protein [Deinococcus sp. KSM4-11]THF87793.1 hypothetical protein E7T09_00695 [Deinococcus sp. KSM4-11]